MRAKKAIMFTRVIIAGPGLSLLSRLFMGPLAEEGGFDGWFFTEICQREKGVWGYSK
jgi:hypothetical protein